MATKPDSKTPTPEAQLQSFIDKFDLNAGKLFQALRTAVRKKFPTANELAYDYSNQVVISYSPTEVAIEAIVAIALRADGVRLYFSQGKRLPDPKGLLLGTATQVRYVEVEAVSRLAHPDVKTLFAAAIDMAEVPMPSRGGGALIIRSDSAKRQARATKAAARRPKPR